MHKLAVIVDTFPRWSERFIARELQELLRRGVQFKVFCLKAGEPLPHDSDWQGLIERRVILPSSFLPRMAKVLTPTARPHWEEARQLLGLRGYRALARAAALRDRLLEGGFGHVHAHFANLPSTLGWLAALDAKLPFSFAAHARDLFLEAQLLEQKLTDCVCVFACHARAREYLRAKTAQKGKVRLMHHGLPLKQYPQRLELGGSGLGIVAAGRFVPKKGFDILLDAAARLARAKREFALMLLGDGPERENLLKKVRALRLERQVVIKKPVGGSELRDILNGADLLVAPYRTASDGDSDGVPNVVLEAFALGTPVIGTEAGSLGEILTPRTGTVVPQNDTAALAEALAEFLERPSEALGKTRAARELVASEYDIRKNIIPLLDTVSGFKF
jgi:glycosyltransferase involved in cell wall biosynthesis